MRAWQVVTAILAWLLSAAASQAEMRVTVTERPSSDAWRVAWELDRDARALGFRRGREPFREAAWTIVEPRGATWAVIDGRDAIVAPRGATRFVVEFPSNFRRRQKDYDINVAFTDGSRLLYTGHLAADMLERCASCETGYARDDEADDSASWRFETDAARTIRTVASMGRGSLDWRPRTGRERDDGTYVYFGSIEPVPAGSMTVLVDPGMPRWLVDGIRAEFPTTFAFHERLTGTRLDFVPLVLLSYEPSGRSGLSFAGGTLDGLVQIAADGKAWETKTAEAERLWFRHVAHEAFHFWDGQMFVADEESEWLSEAAAEYASFLALRERGLLDAQALDRALVEQCNECLVLADGMSIAEAPSKGNFSIVYSCGLVTQLLADRGIARRSPGSGIGVLYRKLFDVGGARRYGAGEFLELVASLAGRSVATDVETLVTHGVARDFDVVLVEALRRGGLEVSLGAATEAAISQGTARAEARAILRRCACAAGEVRLCDDPAPVTCGEGWSIRAAPERAADALHVAIRERAKVRIRGRDAADAHELSCTSVPVTHRSLLVLE